MQHAWCAHFSGYTTTDCRFSVPRRPMLSWKDSIDAMQYGERLWHSMHSIIPLCGPDLSRGSASVDELVLRRSAVTSPIMVTWNCQTACITDVCLLYYPIHRCNAATLPGPVEAFTTDPIQSAGRLHQPYTPTFNFLPKPSTMSVKRDLRANIQSWSMLLKITCFLLWLPLQKESSQLGPLCQHKLQLV